ncbi:MAG TPA: hypothetical protein VIE63_06695 [Ramlibacter sp.]|jgi:hypothetical protein
MLEVSPAAPASRTGVALAPLHFALDQGRVPFARPQFPGLAHEGLAFHELHSPEEFAQVSHLRTEIQLPEAVRADPSFAAREKKEMSRGSWVLSH